MPVVELRNEKGEGKGWIILCTPQLCPTRGRRTEKMLKSPRISKINSQTNNSEIGYLSGFVEILD
jgi:hypothetical protein